MSPPLEIFPASELPQRMQTNLNGFLRKGLVQKELKDCELLEMLQYECEVANPGARDAVVTCRPIERLFRRCQDRNGSFLVETTAWEGRNFNKSGESVEPDQNDTSTLKSLASNILNKIL